MLSPKSKSKTKYTHTLYRLYKHIWCPIYKVVPLGQTSQTSLVGDCIIITVINFVYRI